MRTRTLCAGVVGVLLLLSGCSGGSDDEGGALGAAAVSATTISPEDAVALAQTALLTPEDVGAPWVPVASSNELVPFGDAACAALESSFNDPRHVASTAGIGFETGETAGVYHDVVVVGEPDARRAIDAFQSAGAAACYTTAVTEALEPSAAAAGIDVRVNVLPLSLEAGGDAATNLITVTYTNDATGDEQVVIIRDSVMVSGRAYALFSTIDTPQATHDALMKTARAKLDVVGAAS